MDLSSIFAMHTTRFYIRSETRDSETGLEIYIEATAR